MTSLFFNSSSCNTANNNNSKTKIRTKWLQNQEVALPGGKGWILADWDNLAKSRVVKHSEMLTLAASEGGDEGGTGGGAGGGVEDVRY